MIPLEKFKELMPEDREYSEEEVLELRRDMYSMVEFCFDVWLEDRKKEN